VFKEFGTKSRMLMLTLLPASLLTVALGLTAPQLFTPGSLQQSIIAGGLVLLVIVLSSLIALRAGHALETQLIQLRQGIARLHSGELDSPVDNLRNQALNKLAEDLNQLGKALQNRNNILQRRLNQSQEDCRQHQQSAAVQRIELDMARKETLAASRTKSEFLANMSHEIRTPLNGILGFSQLLQKTALSTAQLDHLQTIRNSAENLLGMLARALDSSRLEAGTLHRQSQPFDLRELIVDCLSVVALAAHQKQLELVSMVYRDTPQRLTGDAEQLKQILINLLGNAVTFTTQGSIVVRAMLEDENSEFARLRISVQDNRVSLDSTELQQVFQSLSQADHARQHSMDGPAMGLPLARRLTELMGGEIGMDSTCGAGAELWICISLAKVADLPEPPPKALQGQRVALFEEHQLAHQSLKHQLIDYGLEVLSFARLDQLLQAIDEQQHDASPIRLALLGINDCALAGEQLGRHLHSLQQSNCKLLLLCPTSGQERLSTLVSAEGCQLLSKPAGGRKLARALEELLKPRTAGTQQQRLPTPPVDQSAPRVLCVDDNPSNLLLVQSLLQGMGAMVTAVDSGYAAVQANIAQDFDLILMDIQMPGMDGVQASKAIRLHEQQFQRQAVPIIALTAHVLPQQKRKLLLAGLNDLLNKPVSETQLAQLLQKWTSKQLRPALPELPSPTTATLAILDHNEGLHLAGGKAELATDLLGMLLDSLDQEQQAIVRARASNDAIELAARVHRLLGATRYCGVPELRSVCQHCENLLRQGDPQTGQALEQLDLAISRLRSESRTRQLNTGPGK